MKTENQSESTPNTCDYASQDIQTTDLQQSPVTGPLPSTESIPVDEPNAQPTTGATLPVGAAINTSLIATPASDSTAPASIDKAQLQMVPYRQVKPLNGMMPVNQLRPHEENAKIYGAKESIDDLLKSIKAHGILDPLLITRDGRVISGHRRFRVTEKLGIAEVPVRVFESEDEIEILNALLEHNRQRIKTKAQIAAEASLRMRIEKERGAKRKQGIAIEGVVATLPPGSTGKSRDIVGKSVGMSGRTAEKAAETSDAIAALRENGKTEIADQIESALNKGYHTGFKAAVEKGAIPKKQKAAKTAATVSPKAQRPTGISATATTSPPDVLKVTPIPTDAQTMNTPSVGVLDADRALTKADDALTFLRSPAAKTMTRNQKNSWTVLLDQINTHRKNLGL